MKECLHFTLFTFIALILTMSIFNTLKVAFSFGLNIAGMQENMAREEL